MRSLSIRAMTYTFILAMVSPASAQTPVWIESNVGSGQGVTRLQRNRCAVITSGHVVAGAAVVTVVSPDGSRELATIQQFNVDGSFAVLQLPQNTSFTCRN